MSPTAFWPFDFDAVPPGAGCMFFAPLFFTPSNWADLRKPAAIAPDALRPLLRIVAAALVRYRLLSDTPVTLVGILTGLRVLETRILLIFVFFRAPLLDASRK